MRRTPCFLAGFVLTLLIAACSRKDKVSGNDCINRSPGIISSFGLTAAQVDTIDVLCTSNNLDPSAYEFTNFYRQQIADGSYIGPGHLVYAGFYVNGLPVFRKSLALYFDSSGTLVTPSNGGWTGPTPGKDTTPRQSLQSLRSIFLNNYKKCTIEGGPINNPPTHPTAPYQDSCLGAMLGYVDASFADLHIPYGTSLLKAWVVAAADQMSFNFNILPYPSVMVIDSTARPIPLVLEFP